MKQTLAWSILLLLGQLTLRAQSQTDIAKQFAGMWRLVSNPQRLAGLPFLIHRHKHGKLLVSVTSDKLFYIAAAPPCARGFARSLRETPLQRFHSIIIGMQPRYPLGHCARQRRCVDV